MSQNRFDKNKIYKMRIYKNQSVPNLISDLIVD